MKEAGIVVYLCAFREREAGDDEEGLPHIIRYRMGTVIEHKTQRRSSR